MDLRKNVKIEGIPIVWNTNLDDNGMREFYAILSRDQDLAASKISVAMPKPGGPFGIGISIKLFDKCIDFREGHCWVLGFNERFWVIYRSTLGWNVWNASQAELKELKDEQAEQRRSEDLIFTTEDDHLREIMVEELRAGNVPQAISIYQQRIAMRGGIDHPHDHLRNPGFLRDEGISAFARVRVTEASIAFLDRYAKVWWNYQRFAERYRFCHRASDQTWVELNKVFRAAVPRYPNEGMLFKWICLFWERESQTSRAAEYCQLAIDLRLSDDTKTGFEGRIKRLRKKLALQHK